MSNIFVLPGTGGLAINEAMAYGLPVICSEADGTEKDLVIKVERGQYELFHPLFKEYLKNFVIGGVVCEP